MKKLFFILVLSFNFLGCASDKGVSESFANISQSKMLKDANAAYVNKDYGKAAESYEAIASYYPGNKIAKDSQLKAMYLKALLKQTDAVEVLAEEFLHQYPRSKEASYAYYLLGVSPLFKHGSFLQRAVGSNAELRGADLLDKSFTRLKAMLRLYPNSPYSSQVKVILYRIKALLALHENDVANYYYSKGLYQAAINRSKDSLAISQVRSTAIPALIIMRNSFIKLGKHFEVARINALISR